MSFDELLDNLWLFDFEVYAHDWLLVLISYRTNKEVVFHNSLPNDVQNFIDMEQPILIGHNAKYYDQYILKAVLNGYTPEEIKEVNDYIINGGQGFELDYGYVKIPPVWDTIQDIVPMKSLKEIEGNLLLDITETGLSFDSPDKWSKEDYEEVLYYCRADVNALRPLFDARKDYFETKFDLCMLCNIDPKINIGLTNAKLCAKFLEANLIERDDERDFTLPKTIDLKYIDNKIWEFFKQIYDKNIPSEELFKTKLEYEEHGMPSVISWGGKHGALLNFIFVQQEHPDLVCINADFESLYPHILALEEYNTISRNIKDSKAYYNTLQNRLRLKHEGKKKEQLALKLVLNTTYGCLLNQYNDLYDPRGARSTCITGQLLISELTERIYRIGSVQLIQINTDGVMVVLPRTKLDEYYKVCEEFSNKVKIKLEYDIIDKIVQRDVNNYILYMKDKDHYKIKAKGGIFSNLPKLEMKDEKNIVSEYVPNFKTNSMTIVSEAIARYLLIGTPIRETIENCNNIYEFQQISHLGSTYEKCVQESPNGDIELQRNNRIYAGLEPSGSIIKVKPNGRRDSLANCPPNPIVDNGNECTINDINKEWYIEFAQEKANDFLGIPRLESLKKEELLEKAKELGLEIDKKTKKTDLIEMIKNVERNEVRNMATKQELEERLQKATEQNEKLVEKIKGMENGKEMKFNDERLNDNIMIQSYLYHKINALRSYIRGYKFIYDEELPSNLGGGEYYSIGQLYNALQEGCLKVGLDFSYDVDQVISFDKELVKPSGKLPIHVATVRTKAVLTDVDTGISKEYFTIAQGSDTIDKAISGASTLAFRQWFTKNFSPKDANDENDIPNETPKSEEPKTPVYIPETKKEEIKKEVVQQVQTEESDDEDIKQIVNNIMKVRELSGDENYGAPILQMFTSGVEVDSATILEIDLKVKNKLEKVGNNG